MLWITQEIENYDAIELRLLTNKTIIALFDEIPFKEIVSLLLI